MSCTPPASGNILARLGSIWSFSWRFPLNSGMGVLSLAGCRFLDSSGLGFIHNRLKGPTRRDERLFSSYNDSPPLYGMHRSFWITFFVFPGAATSRWDADYIDIDIPLVRRHRWRHCMNWKVFKHLTDFLSCAVEDLTLLLWRILY